MSEMPTEDELTSLLDGMSKDEMAHFMANITDVLRKQIVKLQDTNAALLAALQAIIDEPPYGIDYEGARSKAKAAIKQAETP